MTSGEGSTTSACPVRGEVTPLYGTAVADDPHGLYARLREEHGPVAPVELEPGVPAWLVLGYRELLTLTRDEEHFSKDSRLWRDLAEGRVSPDSPLLPMMGWRPTLLFADGDEHARLRAAVAHSLDRIDQRRLRLHVRQSAVSLIAEFCKDGEADLMGRFARHLPLRVFTRLLGVPDDEGPRLIDVITHLVDSGEESVRAAREFEEMLAALLRRKKEEPGEDLVSWLLAHPAGLSDAEVLHHLLVVLVAGNETTINWICNTLRLVLTDDRFRTSLSGGPLTLSDALEEVLWWDPPTQNFPGRWATRDTVLGDRTIRAGDVLILGLAGANADPAVRPSGPRGTIGNRAHLAWGAGPHACPAQVPARAIAHTAVKTLLHHLPDLRIAVPEEELTWRPSPWSRALTALPARFTPVEPPPETAEPAVTRLTFPRLAQAGGRSATPGSGSHGTAPISGETSWTHPAAAPRPPAHSDTTSTPTTPSSGTPEQRRWWSFLARFTRGR